jgi:plastocyanin
MIRIPAGLLAVVLVGCGGGGGTPTSTESDPNQAALVHLTCATGDADAPCAFRPAEVTVRAGESVRWVNDDATFHTVTSSDRQELRQPNGRFDAVLDTAGESFSYTFEEPGSYPYYCQPHAEFMAGTIRVLPR